MLEIRNAQRGIELAHVCQQFLRFIESPGERVTCRRPPYRGQVIWSRAQCVCRHCRRIIIAPGEKMSVRKSRMHLEDQRIEWAQAYGMCQVLDRHFRIAEK